MRDLLAMVVVTAFLGCGLNVSGGESKRLSTSFGELVATSTRAENGDIHSLLVVEGAKAPVGSLDYSLQTGAAVFRKAGDGDGDVFYLHPSGAASVSLERANRVVHELWSSAKNGRETRHPEFCCDCDCRCWDGQSTCASCGGLPACL